MKLFTTVETESVGKVVVVLGPRLRSRRHQSNQLVHLLYYGPAACLGLL